MEWWNALRARVSEARVCNRTQKRARSARSNRSRLPTVMRCGMRCGRSTALQAPRTHDIVQGMSTADLISELRALSSRERARIIRAVIRATDSKDRATAAAKPAVRKVKWPDLAALKRKIYGDRLMPNLVLLEREEMRY